MITLNGKEIKPTIFPDGTSQVWKLDNIEPVKKNRVVWEFENEGELMHVAQLGDLLHSVHSENSLHMPFLPYGRQDKKVRNDRTFALRTFCSILNTMPYKSITTFDAHSKLSMSLGVVVNTRPIDEVREAISNSECNFACLPDSGAFDKYNSYLGMEFFGLNKTRNQLTGELKMEQMAGDYIKDKSVLIVDDICDGGGTFILAAKNMFEAGAKEVYLYVSHGIFSKGTDILKEAGISKLYTKEGRIY